MFMSSEVLGSGYGGIEISHGTALRGFGEI